MDLKELKKLINEEVQRTRSKNLLNEEETTEPGRKKPRDVRPMAQPEPFIEPEQDPSEEPKTFKDSLKDATPQELEAQKQRLSKELIPKIIKQETLWKLMLTPNLEADVSNIISDLLFVYTKLSKKSAQADGTSELPDRPGGAGLPTPTAIGRNPHLKTASINPADAPTTRNYSSVEPIGVDEPTRTKAR